MPLEIIALPVAFENDFVRSLPGDPEHANGTRQVQGACYSLCEPQAPPAPVLHAVTADLAADLGLSTAALNDPAFTRVFSGGARTLEMQPYAMCYGGHQFGSWAGQLGDGRAINLGELRNGDGRLIAVQLKGAGPTPYSRRADGFAVLRSSLREFVCSEAMHALGVPTTRALSLITTGAPVLRDMFYDGHPRLEPGAVVCRTAESFVRFGNFEIFAARGDIATLERLADFVISRYFPECAAPAGIANGPENYLAMFSEIVRRTARLTAAWQSVGFVHGVMNTDNMSITGLTIDYGPYGWLEPYDPSWTPNTTDAQMRRFTYGNQPAIGAWNTARLAQALHPLIGDPAALSERLGRYADEFDEAFIGTMKRKLGIGGATNEEFGRIFDGLEALFAVAEFDMTIFFRELGNIDPLGSESANIEILAQAMYDAPSAAKDAIQRLGVWLRDYVALTDQHPESRRAAMHAVNPKFVLRNYLAQTAIEAAEAGDYGPMHRLIDVLRRPFDEQPAHAELAAKRPDWAREKPGASALSCSS